MKKANLTISFDSEKLSAIKGYMIKKDADLTSELDDIMQKLYEKHVPPQVCEYIESRSDDDTEVPERLKKPPVKPNKPIAKTADISLNDHSQTADKE